MPKGNKYGRPSNRDTKSVAKNLKPSGDPKVTLNAARTRARRNRDIMNILEGKSRTTRILGPGKAKKK